MKDNFDLKKFLKENKVFEEFNPFMAEDARTAAEEEGYLDGEKDEKYLLLFWALRERQLGNGKGGKCTSLLVFCSGLSLACRFLTPFSAQRHSTSDSFWLACHPAVVEHAMFAVLNGIGATAPVLTGVELRPCTPPQGRRAHSFECGLSQSCVCQTSLDLPGDRVVSTAARGRVDVGRCSARSPQLVMKSRRLDRSRRPRLQRSFKRAEECEPCANVMDALIFRARSRRSISVAATSLRAPPPA